MMRPLLALVVVVVSRLLLAALGSLCFAALLPDRFVDADRGRTVLCRIGQR